MCVYCMLCLQGKGDRTGKLYWASLVELAELAGISGRAGPGRDTHKPGTMLGHQAQGPGGGRASVSGIITQTSEYAASTGLITSSDPDNSLQLEGD